MKESILTVDLFYIRVAVLWIVFVPLLLFHPFGRVSSTARELWWRLTVWLCQRSGPTLIKLGQWASTRRDLFSKEFCDKVTLFASHVTRNNNNVVLSFGFILIIIADVCTPYQNHSTPVAPLSASAWWFIRRSILAFVPVCSKLWSDRFGLYCTGKKFLLQCINK